MQPIKTIHHSRLSYLLALEKGYNEMGYPTKLKGINNLLEIYQKGVIVPKTEEEIVIDKWIN